MRTFKDHLREELTAFRDEMVQMQDKLREELRASFDELRKDVVDIRAPSTGAVPEFVRTAREFGRRYRMLPNGAFVKREDYERQLALYLQGKAFMDEMLRAIAASRA